MSNTAIDNGSVRVVGLVGSLRPGSYTRLGVQLALQGAAELGHILTGSQ